MASPRAHGMRMQSPSGIAAGASSYRAAETSRWRPSVIGAGSGDRHADARARAILRDRSQDMERNVEPYHVMVHGAARLFGAPSPRPTVGDDEWRALVVRRWRQRAKSRRAGFDRRGIQTWGALCRSWWTSWLVDGDVAYVPQTDGSVATIEADQICGGPARGNQYRRTVGGITLDAQDRPVQVWIAPRTSSGIVRASEAKPVEAELVHLLVSPWRVSQTRGLPLITAGLDNQERVDALVESEVITAEQASTIYGAMQRSMTPGQVPPGVPLSNSTEYPAGTWSGEGATSDDRQPMLQQWSAGSYFELPAGMTWQQIDTNRPNLNVVEMLRQVLRVSAATIGIPMPVLYADFHGINWSGNRGLISLAREALRWWRGNYCEPFIDPVYGYWLETQMRSGAIPKPAGVPPQDIYDHAWDWPMPEWPDPYKEEQRHGLALQQGTDSLHRILGPEWENVLRERNDEVVLQDRLYIDRVLAVSDYLEEIARSRGATPPLSVRDVIARSVEAAPEPSDDEPAPDPVDTENEE